jgi:serine/threonine-protein kinase
MAFGTPTLELATGTVFADRYQIKELLGRGGMAVVYRATDTVLADDVALKLMPLHAEEYRASAMRFRQEVRLARRVNHPHVIRVYDIGEHNGYLYLTMEFIAGSTLRSLMRKRGPLPPQQAMSMARTIAEALGAAHATEVIHRDLKPTNVLVDEAGRLVLTDFGIARGLDDDLGLTHGALGTANYMAPEQATNGRIDARTDIYALGVVLYEMLVGERPAGNSTDIAARIERESAEIAPALAALTLRCLSLDPNARPQSTAAFIAAIDALMEATDEKTAFELDFTQASAQVQSPPIAPTSAVEATSQKLAILPFRYRGPPDQQYVAEVLTDELVDAISRTRGLFVLGSGALERFRSSRDPIAIGKELGVCAIIDGAVQAGGNHIRVSVRLIDATTGVQRWVQQHDGDAKDLFQFQDSVVRRVAEELRIELSTMVHSMSAPTSVVEAYIEARHEMRTPDPTSVENAVKLLDGVLALAPGFLPAIAAHALASCRAWFLGYGKKEPPWQSLALASVKRALQVAPDIAETHLAAGSLATNRGEYHLAIPALQRALEIAPTCAPAHEFVGILQSEAGHLEKAIQHLTLATELDPHHTGAWAHLARTLSLSNQRQRALAAISKLEAFERTDRFRLSMVARVRDAMWHNDLRAFEAVLPAIEWSAKQSLGRFTEDYLGVLRGRQENLDALLRHPSELDPSETPRYKILARQWISEVVAFKGHLELALDQICRAAREPLADIYWLEHCPIFVPLHGDPRFVEAVRLTRERASVIPAF